MRDPKYTIDKTQDEFGTDRYFVADENGDWVGDAHDTVDQAQQEVERLVAAYHAERL